MTREIFDRILLIKNKNIRERFLSNEMSVTIGFNINEYMKLYVIDDNYIDIDGEKWQSLNNLNNLKLKHLHLDKNVVYLVVNSLNINNKLMNLFLTCHSYFKCGANKIAKRVNCSPITVNKFRKSDWYKLNRKNYC